MEDGKNANDTNKGEPLTKENLNECLGELGKQYRKLNGKNGISAEIILIGGAAVLSRYGFRDMTYDVDAVMKASSAMKDAISKVAETKNLPHKWLNADFERTSSYSKKLSEVSIPYKMFANGALRVRAITGEHLVAMKLMSGREYKQDLSDAVGILMEHAKIGEPISRGTIESAFTTLYGESATMPDASKRILNLSEQAGTYENLSNLYEKVRDDEKQAKRVLTGFNNKYPDVLRKTNDEGISNILKTLQAKDSNAELQTPAQPATKTAMGKTLNSKESPQEIAQPTGKPTDATPAQQIQNNKMVPTPSKKPTTPATKTYNSTRTGFDETSAPPMPGFETVDGGTTAPIVNTEAETNDCGFNKK